MKLMRRMIWFLLPVVLVAGCATRTIYVPNGDPVRLRETVHRAKVWVLDKDGQPTAGVMDLPEGWYALPVPSAAEGPVPPEAEGK